MANITRREKATVKIRKSVVAIAIGVALAFPIGMGVASAAPEFGASVGPIGIAGSVAGAAGGTFANCTALNKKYPHGVGKSGAKDKVTGSAKPVKNFTVSTSVYNKNKKSDRDKDGIACEKK
ncbi:MAG: excalibur calcium-binding domain-containing protein [Microbacteriaceae bacterium]